jgi:hypothetical protein
MRSKRKTWNSEPFVIVEEWNWNWNLLETIGYYWEILSYEDRSDALINLYGQNWCTIWIDNSIPYLTFLPESHTYDLCMLDYISYQWNY